MRDAVDTSYRDLPAPLAALHRSVGAVPGPFTAELAAGLVGDPPLSGLELIAEPGNNLAVLGQGAV